MKTIKTTPINKISKVVLALVAVAVTLTSCKKDEEITPNPTAPVSKEVKNLTSGNWALETVTINGNDVRKHFMDECELDDVTTFKKDGTYITDEGAMKCDPNDSQTIQGVWEFAHNYTKLIVDNEDEMWVTLLTKNELHTKDTMYEDGVVYITEMTFTSK